MEENMDKTLTVNIHRNCKVDLANSQVALVIQNVLRCLEYAHQP